MTFDPKTHAYTNTNGTRIPSVTEIIREVINPPQWAEEWHLRRGRANHACYAMIADGVQFKCDPQSDPYVNGCRLFFRDFEPYVMACECVMIGKQYAGTPDLIALIKGALTIIDYKNSPCYADDIQLAAYSILYKEHTGVPIKQLLRVVINGDGRYKASEMVRGVELRRSQARWAAVLAVYKMKKEAGAIK